MVETVMKEKVLNEVIKRPKLSNRWLKDNLEYGMNFTSFPLVL